MRELDERFLHLAPGQRTKEYFSFVLENGLRMIYDRSTPFSLIEFGCARGDFLSMVSAEFLSARLTGIDIREDVIEMARLDFPHITFNTADLLSIPPDTGQFDCACMLTVHSLFDDIEAPLDALLSTVKKGGHAFVFGLFNPAALNVMVKVNCAGQSGNLITGWNIHSEASVAAFLGRRGCRFTFNRYIPSRAKRSDDDENFSSWTQELADGTLQLINGLQIIHRFALLQIAV